LQVPHPVMWCPGRCVASAAAAGACLNEVKPADLAQGQFWECGSSRGSHDLQLSCVCEGRECITSTQMQAATARAQRCECMGVICVLHTHTKGTLS
jgi:hypothetical protein